MVTLAGTEGGVVERRVRIVMVEGGKWVRRAERMWVPKVPVAPMRAMWVNGISKEGEGESEVMYGDAKSLDRR